MDGQVYASVDRLPWMDAGRAAALPDVDKPGNRRFRNEIFHAN